MKCVSIIGSMLATLAMGCASAPEERPDSASGRDPKCVRALVHVGAILGGISQDEFRASPEAEQLLEGCTAPEARGEVAQAMFDCTLKANDQAGLEACKAAESSE